MNTESTMIHVRLNRDLKERASTALAAMGLTTADAVRFLFHRIVADQAFPLELKAPDAEARRAMTEAEEIMERAKMDRRAETPLETAARIRRKYGVSLSSDARRTLPEHVFDEMWGDDLDRGV